MSTFLRLLPLELAEIEEDSFIEPEDEVAPNEHVVGEMTPDQKRLYTKCRLLRKEGLDVLNNLTICRRNEQQQLAKASELARKSQAISEMFWVAINDEFALWDKDHIGVREGFKVVWIESNNEETPPPGDFLKWLFEQHMGGEF